MDEKHAKLIAAMVHYDKGDAKRIQHFLKVHDLAATIGKLEKLNKATQFILETAAILHDIGIHVSEQKYGSSSGKYQEIEGPIEAQKLMEELGGYTEEQIERVKYLIGHHHTYKNIEGMDYQILVEADFLVNIYEDEIKKDAVEYVKSNIFKTESGKQLLMNMYIEELF